VSTADDALRGLEPGEWIQDIADPRFAARYPRTEGETDTAYALRLETEGRAVLLTEASMKSGGYPRAWAAAVSRGVPLLTPVAKAPPAPPPRVGVRDGGLYVLDSEIRDPERFRALRQQAEEAGLELRSAESG
jgi:hypothetical protein